MTYLNNILIFGLVNAISVVVLHYFIDNLYKKKAEIKKIYNTDNLKLFFVVLVVSMISFKLINNNESSNSLVDMEVQRGTPDF